MNLQVKRRRVPPRELEGVVVDDVAPGDFPSVQPWCLTSQRCEDRMESVFGSDEPAVAATDWHASGINHGRPGLSSSVRGGLSRDRAAARSGRDRQLFRDPERVEHEKHKTQDRAGNRSQWARSPPAVEPDADQDRYREFQGEGRDP